MKANEVTKLLKITRMTLHNYMISGRIKATKLPNGYYDYNKEDVYKILGNYNERENVIYARVSSTCQKKDLETQLETLRTFCNNNGIKINNEYSDICSGLNLDRKNFQKMLNDITEYKIKNIYITYKDRLTRLSYNVFKELFAKYGVEIIVLNEIDNPKEIEKEIFEEIITLIHSLCMKMYSQRRKEKLNIMEKELKLEQDIKE